MKKPRQIADKELRSPVNSAMLIHMKHVFLTHLKHLLRSLRSFRRRRRALTENRIHPATMSKPMAALPTKASRGELLADADCVFVPGTQTYYSRRYQIHYCSSCVSAGIRSPLKEYPSGWECSHAACRKFFPNFEYDPPVDIHDH